MCQSKANGGRRCPSFTPEIQQARKLFPSQEHFTGDDFDRTDYSNQSQAYIDTLTPEERTSVQGYVQQDYSTINENLWEGNVPAVCALIDKAIEKYVSDPRIVYRKPVISDRDLVPVYKVGSTLTFKGYTSSSVNPNAMIPLLTSPVSESLKERDPELYEELDRSYSNVVYQIFTEQGAPVSQLSHMPQEAEYLLPRNQTFKIVKVLPKVTFETDENLATGEKGWHQKRECTVVQLIPEKNS